MSRKKTRPAAGAAITFESGPSPTIQQDRTAEVTAFAAAAVWTGITNDDRAAWLAEREKLLTASDMAAVLGLSPWSGPVDVFQRKVTPPNEPERLGLDDPRFWGTVLEQPILRAVAAFHGWAYRPGGALLRSRKHPHLGATLDAEIDRGAGWEDFEGKTTRITSGWDQEEQELPDHVLIQVQHQLLVTGAQRAVVFALLQGSRPCTIEVYPSDEMHSIIAEESERFLELVRRRVAPRPTGQKRETDALGRLYPTADGSVVRLGPEAVEWTREILELNRVAADAKKRGDELRNALRAAIGPATWGVLPEPVEGKTSWRWANEHVEAYTVPARDGRKLLAMVKGPAYSPELPPASPVPSLAEQLAESVEVTAPVEAPKPKKRTKKEKAT